MKIIRFSKSLRCHTCESFITSFKSLVDEPASIAQRNPTSTEDTDVRVQTAGAESIPLTDQHSDYGYNTFTSANPEHSEDNTQRENQKLHHVLLDCSAWNSIDISGIRTLLDVLFLIISCIFIPHCYLKFNNALL